MNDEFEILGESIPPGSSKTLNLSIAKLYTTTKIDIPVIVERSKNPGPVVLITAGIHGDEINGIEIVRQLISKKINKPNKGTIICIPILNIFGFLNGERNFPDGKDLNRVFPGSRKGSLASRVAYHFSKEILPLANYCIDFHTGGASRFNAPQVRIKPDDRSLLKLAKIFNAPFTVLSPIIAKSYRSYCTKNNIPILLFEGGKSIEIDKNIVKHGVEGIKKFLDHLEMLPKSIKISTVYINTQLISKSTWIRAQKSGLLHVNKACNSKVKKGDLLATITDPYGTMHHDVLASNSGYIINVNQASIVHQGDALFHISTAT